MNLEEKIGNEFLVHMKTDLLLIKDSIMTDRHSRSSPNNSSDYDENYPQNLISGIVPPFSLNGWLRHGMESVLIDKRTTVCHPTEPNANLKRDEELQRDLDNGYHEKGSCAENSEPCLIFELFGGFEGTPGKFLRKPIHFSPVRGDVDFMSGDAEAHYRRVVRNVTSRNKEDNRIPFRNVNVDALANFNGTWKLVFREMKPEYIGLLSKTIKYLNEKKQDFMHQLGGSRNFGGGIVNCKLMNPLYDEKDISNYFDRGRNSKTKKMKEKDEEWNEILEKCEKRLDEKVKELEE